MANIRPTFSVNNPPPLGGIQRHITVKNDFIGFHAYENAPDKVAFLKCSHRHRFYVESSIDVFHDDRELEFFMTQELIEREIIPFITCKGNIGSCEQLAEGIMYGLINAYGSNRWISVKVSEDGENSATVTWNPYS